MPISYVKPIFVLGALTLALCGCHAPAVNATIENHSGARLQMIELDYPSASFGVNALADGGSYPYSFQVHGSGKLHISFLDAKGAQHQADGPEMEQDSRGTLHVIIGADDKVTWQQ